MTSSSNRLTAALKAAGFHLCLSLLVAALAAALVFGLWYPYPYRELVGGRALFMLVVGVDVVCGPLLTAVLFNPAKARAELARDLTLVVLIQLAALGYGMYSVALARPVHMAFEVDRLRIVTAAEVQPEDFAKTKFPWNTLPWTGPSLIGVRDIIDSDDMMKSLDLSLQGNEPSQRPHWWQDYSLSTPAVLKRAKPITALRNKHPQEASQIDAAVRESGQAEATLLWLPLTSFRTTTWVALIDAKTAQPLAYAPLDGF
ncbi:TfpX/TfpZ family type IV pilin accessory protein [Polaromonas sp.]|uniref:TfpX/TfpZ family type IV pilin accessory protein n=1 Tax=Polaromonas sp. TaxID=1869339 RepID=UPI00286C2523|nr:TfpX/TfpZ family type IV pilin accessory protein [Polaromonas sp.]